MLSVALSTSLAYAPVVFPGATVSRATNPEMGFGKAELAGEYHAAHARRSFF